MIVAAGVALPGESFAGCTCERMPPLLLRVRLRAAYRMTMCRSIKTLRRPGESATTGELEAAARQYVRKLSGFREPSARNQAAFETAIADISAATRRLMESVGVPVEDGPDRWTARPTAVPIAHPTARTDAR